MESQVLSELTDYIIAPCSNLAAKQGSDEMLFSFFLHTGCLDSVSFSSPKRVTTPIDHFSKRTRRNVKALRAYVSHLKCPSRQATAPTPDPFCQPKKNADSYLVQKYPSFYARHLFSREKW